MCNCRCSILDHIFMKSCNLKNNAGNNDYGASSKSNSFDFKEFKLSIYRAIESGKILSIEEARHKFDNKYREYPGDRHNTLLYEISTSEDYKAWQKCKRKAKLVKELLEITEAEEKCEQ